MLFGALVAKISVLADHFIRLVLRDDLVAVVSRRVEVCLEDGLDNVSKLSDFLRRAPFDDVELDERHAESLAFDFGVEVQSSISRSTSVSKLMFPKSSLL